MALVPTRVETRLGRFWNATYWVLIAAALLFLASTRFELSEGRGTTVLMLGISLAIMVSVSFMSKQSNMGRAVSIACLAILLLATAYFYHERLNILMRAPLLDSDRVLGLLYLVMAALLVQRAFGWVFPALALTGVVYAVVAPSLPDPFSAPPYSPVFVFDRLTNYLFVGLVNITWQYLWLLLFWGMLLGTAGFSICIFQFGGLLSRKFTGGPAYMTLGTSSLAGTFTGIGGTNAAITGPITIPMMKRGGFRAEQAGAIECLASNVAGLLPPILGTAAFLMVEFLQVSYAEIILVSIVPAAMWLTTLGTYLFAYTKRHSGALQPVADDRGESVSRWLLLRSVAVGLIPLTIMISLAAMDFPLSTVVTYAFFSLVVLAVLFRVETRWVVWSAGIKNAAYLASGVTGALLLLEAFNQSMVISGLSVKLGDIIWAVSGGSLVVAVVVMYVAGLFLGGPLPSVTVYLIMAITFVPVMLRFDIPPLTSHYVAFYMGLLGTITPPVATSAIVVAPIAGSTYWKVARESVRMGVPIMIAPLVMPLAPELLLQGTAGPGQTVLRIVAFMIGSACVSFASAGWLGRDLSVPQRVIVGSAYAVLFAGIYFDNNLLVATTLVVPVGTLVWNQRPWERGVHRGTEERLAQFEHLSNTKAESIQPGELRKSSGRRKETC